MPTYATSTQVSSEKTRLEIERTLKKYGATRYVYDAQERVAVIAFEIKNRRVRMTLPLPDPTDREFIVSPAGRMRSPTARAEAYEQSIRQRWRALLLVIKANLEAVECGIASLEDIFMPYVILPNRQTVGEWMQPQIAQAYTNGAMPQLLLPAPNEE